MPSSTDERTPLLPTHRFDLPSSSSSSPSSSSPTSIQLAQLLAALRLHKLPSTSQLSSLTSYLLSTPLLAPSPSLARNGTYGASEASGEREAGRDAQRDRARAMEGFKDQFRELVKRAVRMVEEKNGDDLVQELVWCLEGVEVGETVDLIGINTTPEHDLPRDLLQLLKSLFTLLLLPLIHARSASILAIDELLLLFTDFLADATSITSTVAADVSKSLRPDLGIVGQSENGQRELLEEHPQGTTATAEAAAPSSGGETGVGEEALDRVRAEAAEKADKLKSDAKTIGEDISDGTSRIRSQVRETGAHDVRDAVVERIIRLAKHIQTDPSFKNALRNILDMARKYGPSESSDLDPGKESSLTNEEGDVSLASVLLPNMPEAPNPTPTQIRLEKAAGSFEKLVERLAGRSMEPLLRSFTRVVHLVRTSPPETHSYLVDLGDYLQRVIDEPAWARSRGAQREAEELWERGRELRKMGAEEKGREDGRTVWGEMKNFFGELGELMKGVRQDEDLKAVGEAAKDTFMTFISPPSTAGLSKKRPNRSMTTAVLGGAWSWTTTTAFYFIRQSLPTLGSLIKHLPVPRVEASTPTIDFLLDDLVLESLSFLPEVLHLEARLGVDIVPPREEVHPRTVGNKIKSAVGVEERAEDRDKTRMRITLSGLRLNLRNLSFFVRIKSAFLPFFNVHTGLLDLDLSKDGPGIEAVVEILMQDADPPPYDQKTHMIVAKGANKTPLFTVEDVKVSVPSFTFKIRKSNHRILLFFLRPLAIGVVRLLAGKAIQIVGRQQLEKAGMWMGDVSREVGRRRRERGEEGLWAVVGSVKTVLEKEKEDADEDAEGEEGEGEGEEEGAPAEFQISSQAIVRHDPSHSLDIAIGLPSMSTSDSPSTPGILPTLEHESGPEPTGARIAREAEEATRKAQGKARKVGAKARNWEETIVMLWDPEGQVRDSVRRADGDDQGEDDHGVDMEGWRSKAFDLA